MNQPRSLPRSESHGGIGPARSARVARNRLLPEGRLTGPMPWVIAIMMFLTVLASALGLGLGVGMLRLQGQLEGKLTVQLVEANAEMRQRQVARVAAALRADRHVAQVRIVPDSELAEQLRPWLGEDMGALDLPVPALIDVAVMPGQGGGNQAVRGIVRAIAPAARIDADAGFLAPVERLMRVLLLLAGLLVVLMLSATAAVVLLAARGAHDSNRDTIEILHMLGATDAQIARLFQRRMALDALFGGLVGFWSAVAALLLVGQQIVGSGSELAQLASLPLWGWALLPLLPLLGTLLAMLVARITVRRTLERSL
jgi:cell division transport system permease protein